MRLESKVVIVTGAARNIGREYALGLAAEGASVVVADVRDPGATVRDIESKGGQALGVSVDIADEASVTTMTAATMDRFGRIDGIVNNAALYGDVEQGPLEALSTETWDRTFAVNTRGTFLCMKAVFPIMREQGEGSIVNVSSATVWNGTPYAANYVSSKAALIGLTRSAAREGGPAGIRVNAITPGFTMSDASKEILQRTGMGDAAADAVRQGTALGRLGQPSDLVGTVLFLISDDSAFVTGQTINVDGGSHLH
jgi:NAD(P)-dependent dehydrogenase (short-subunit alcohol dehydrogenase family)